MSTLEIVLTAGIAIISTLFSLLVRMYSSKLELTDARIAAAEAHAQRVEALLADFRLQTALDSKNYVTNEAMTRLETSMDTFKSAVFEKLDMLDRDMRRAFGDFRDRLDLKEDKEKNS